MVWAIVFALAILSPSHVLLQSVSTSEDGEIRLQVGDRAILDCNNDEQTQPCAMSHLRACDREDLADVIEEPRELALPARCDGIGRGTGDHH